MSDYIDREALKSAIYADGNLTAYLDYIINRVPAADVQPVARGKWIRTNYAVVESHKLTLVYPVCSECGFVATWNSNYCPYCGAKNESVDPAFNKPNGADMREGS